VSGNARVGIDLVKAREVIEADGRLEIVHCDDVSIVAVLGGDRHLPFGVWARSPDVSTWHMDLNDLALRIETECGLTTLPPDGDS
jgi:hypothetical protein